jgi:hypothetical protein
VPPIDNLGAVKAVASGSAPELLSAASSLNLVLVKSLTPLLPYILVGFTWATTSPPTRHIHDGHAGETVHAVGGSHSTPLPGRSRALQHGWSQRGIGCAGLSPNRRSAAETKGEQDFVLQHGVGGVGMLLMPRRTHLS